MNKHAADNKWLADDDISAAPHVSEGKCDEAGHDQPHRPATGSRKAEGRQALRQRLQEYGDLWPEDAELPI